MHVQDHTIIVHAAFRGSLCFAWLFLLASSVGYAEQAGAGCLRHRQVAAARVDRPGPSSFQGLT